jgi:cytochrome c biogenesis protein CcmG/thiol:disulfide interchange protein DsbE
MNLALSRSVAFAVGGLLGLMLTLMVLGLADLPRSAAAKLHRGEQPYAPALTLNRLNGDGSVSLAGLQGRTVLLSFWASWCAGCKQETRELEALAKRWASKALTVVGVDVHDTAGAARAFAKESKVSYELVRDGSGQAATTFGVSGLPTTFVISPEGRVVKLFVGIPEAGVLTDEVTALLG